MKANEGARQTVQEAERRSFMWKFGAVVVGGVSSLASLAAGARVFIDPLTRKPKAPGEPATSDGPGEGFYKVATLDMVPEDGVPRRYPVIADRLDAWNYSPNQPIGAVYLRRQPGSDLQVFHSTCPHAGCSVSAVDEAFHCPCHNSSFDWNGVREARPGKKNPSPRDLDQLEYKIVSGDIWVRFQDFYTGRPEKTPKI